MIAKIDGLKTNESTKRRILRLKQVREQSKDVAKKIRQRAQNEKLKEIDINCKNIYLEHQSKLVQHLENIYAERLKRFGASHNSAQEVEKEEIIQEKTDLSKSRGKKAVTELRKEKQMVLDKKKKYLDRKLQARAAANEISREKSTVIHKFNKENSEIEKHNETNVSSTIATLETPQNLNNSKSNVECIIETENFESRTKGSASKNTEPSVPINIAQETTNKAEAIPNKRQDIFAVSEDMPPSLRGHPDNNDDNKNLKTSLTLVSDYIQNRVLCLRETDKQDKRSNVDLKSIRQTIQQTRASNFEDADSAFGKRSGVVMYNHSTRDTKNVGYENIVTRDSQLNEDAYSQATKVNSLEEIDPKSKYERAQAARSKMAVSKQNVDKEFKDTMEFLNSLSKGRSVGAFRNSSFDVQQRNKRRQEKMQNEFSNIEQDRLKNLQQTRTSSNRHTHSAPTDTENDIELSNGAQYSWMPVPESDGSLAIHTIPNDAKDKQSVRFNQVNSYHEYRSRHGHTPPTRDTGDETQRKRCDSDKSNDATECSSPASLSDYLENYALASETRNEGEAFKRSRDMEKIIIYKVKAPIKTTKSKCSKVKRKDDRCMKSDDASGDSRGKTDGEKARSLQDIDEGIYKTSEENVDNIGQLLLGNQDERIKTVLEKSMHSCVCKKSKKCHKQSTCRDDIPESANRIRRCQENVSDSTIKESNSKDKHISNICSDVGSIKLLDETGKFYIGTSGFCKNSDYEVVIQLKRKDDENLDSEKCHEQASIETKKVSLTDAQKNKAPNKKENNHESDTSSINSLSEESNRKTSSDINQIETESESVDKNNKSSVNIERSETNSNNRVSDKCVSTSFHLSYAVSSDTPEIEQHNKPTTSAYTQTNFESPVGRPALVHMSSSNSTTYMSPPELVLPKCLRGKHCKIPTDMCVCYQNSKSPVSKNTQKCKKYNFSECSLNAPPNTVRSTMSDKSKTSVNIRKKKKCSKSKNGSVKHNHQSKQTKKPSTVGCSKIFDIPSINDKAPINPLIKNYIHRLLSLNNEGLKAVEILNQDCSSVSTPGSSVINLPLNINKKHIADNTISLQQLRNILCQPIYKAVENPDDVQLTKIRKVGLKLNGKKRVHKVKSLNVSKKLSSYKKNCHGENQTKSMIIKADQIVNNVIINNNKNESTSVKKKNVMPEKSKRNLCETDLKIPIKEKKPAAAVTSKSESSINKSSASKLSLIRHCKKLQEKHHISSVSTQTSKTANDDELLKLAEGKLHNMERIANLTDKCSKKLSTLSKILDEVRRNKYIASNKISKSDSIESDPISNENNIMICTDLIQKHTEEPKKLITLKEMGTNEFQPLLVNIPKPKINDVTSKLLEVDSNFSVELQANIKLPSRLRTKPPPALSQLNLKLSPDNIIPHELSTVLEVDSPLSMQFKTMHSQHNKSQSSELSASISAEDIKNQNNSARIKQVNPDLIKVNYDLKNQIDLVTLNDITLKPFISIQDFVKQINIGNPIEDAKVRNALNDVINDELSSLHSDGSLPDVVAELLKRNIIDEPFKYDTPSNLDSNLSSVSGLSFLPWSKMSKENEHKSIFISKKDTQESSDSISGTSYPDLENTFKKLGLGWASSTLRKTKEKLALSSSSNTSSSSNKKNKLKLRNNNRGNTLALPISINNSSSTSSASKNSLEKDKKLSHVEQQTSLVDSMTVKEFLTTQLANRITFNNSKSNDTERFVSLYETKMPEEVRNISVHEDHQSLETTPCGSNKRARTSTPVQMFKSGAYPSSSSSNFSNGLFSNAELSSVKVTSNSQMHSTSDKDDLTIPDCSLKITKGSTDQSKSD